MNQYEGFQDRADETHAGLKDGTIGCRFGSEVAQANRVLYWGPRDATLEKDIDDAIGVFVNDTKYRILYLLPEEKCGAHVQGEEYTWKMYGELLHSLLSRRTETFTSPEQLVEGGCPSSFHNHNLNASSLDQLLSSCEYREYICRQTFQDWIAGVIPSKYYPLNKIEITMTAFALGPYYQPLTKLPHPRFAPHFGMFLGYQEDISRAQRGRKAESTDVRAWAEAAAGVLYRQSLHIPEQPIPEGPRPKHIQTWAENKEREKSTVGKIISQFGRQREIINLRRSAPEIARFLLNT